MKQLQQACPDLDAFENRSISGAWFFEIHHALTFGPGRTKGDRVPPTRRDHAAFQRPGAAGRRAGEAGQLRVLQRFCFAQTGPNPLARALSRNGEPGHEDSELLPHSRHGCGVVNKCPQAGGGLC